MAYNLSNFLNSIAPKKTGGSSAFGDLNSGIFGKINSFSSNIGAPKTPQSQYVNSQMATPSSGSWQGPMQPKPDAKITPSNVGATGTTPPKITSPAGQSYINNVASPVNNSAGGSAIGQQNFTAPQEQTNPYMKYLASLFDSELTTNAGKSLTSANERLAGIQSQEEQRALSGRREYDKLLNQSGMLKAGAEESASRSADRTNSSLADLAVQESAAARSAQVAKDTYDMYINAGKSVYEAETAAKKAKQDQDNIDRTFEENKRQFGLEYALKEKEVAIAQQKANADSAGAGGQAGSYRENAMNNINNYVDEALNQVKPGTAGFGSGLLGAIRGSGSANLKNTLTTIKANIGFEALQAMREASKTGGALGQVAVQELEALQAILGSLDQKQSREQLTQNLNNIKTHYQNAINALNNSKMGGSVAPSSSGVTPGGIKYTIIQ